MQIITYLTLNGLNLMILARVYNDSNQLRSGFPGGSVLVSARSVHNYSCYIKSNNPKRIKENTTSKL